MCVFMKSVSCSMYIAVFFEYSNSMWGLPGVDAPPIVSSRQQNGRVGKGATTMRMRDNVALVTGAGSGIGRATALGLAADVTDAGACARMVEATLARFGRLTT